jgi:hypothetical protein
VKLSQSIRFCTSADGARIAVASCGEGPVILRVALGAQASEKRLTEVIRSGCFTSVRRATQTPLNMVLEAT